MRIGAMNTGGFEAYRDYTAILRKSAHMESKVPTIENEQDHANVIDIGSNDDTPELQPTPKQFEPVDLERTQESLYTIPDFEVIGRDSKLEDLDVDKAISDMKRDSILQDYQYFVGNAV